jgi:ABC-type dipeptide/oligopeptide/nickel transport system permease subunit
MAASKNAIQFSLKRFANFLKAFKRNRRGILGIAILIFFCIAALIAHLLTPYDPVADEYLAGDYAVPFWFKYLFGDRNISENFYMLSEPGFPTSSSLLNEWNFTTTSPEHVSIRHDSWGNEEPGSAAVTFRREAGKYVSGVVEARLWKKFRFPYHAPPTRFTVQASFFAEGVEDLQQVEIVLSIKRVENNSEISYPLWNKKIYKDSEIWRTPDKPLDSYHSSLKVKFGNMTADPSKILFSKAGDYIYEFQIFFTDSRTTLSPVEAIIYLDDLNIKFYGNAFGLLGTDHRGRDIFTQLIHGARISLFVGLLTSILSVIIGLVVGLVSGYLGKVIDEILMRFTDMLLVLPTLPLLIVLIAVLGPSIWNVILLLSLMGWMSFARWVRSTTLSLKERPFVEAAKAVGAGKFHIIARHILPNVMSLVYVSLALSVPGAILAEAALSWLGLFDPRLISWGRMLHDAQFEQGITLWWWIIPPGLCIALVSLSFILLGYALDEMLNPKLRRRR